MNILFRKYSGEYVANSELYENIIKKHIKEIILDKDITLNEKKQCILVVIGLADLYYNIKYKK